MRTLLPFVANVPMSASDDRMTIVGHYVYQKLLPLQKNKASAVLGRNMEVFP
jgi:hypothetical protein